MEVFIKIDVKDNNVDQALRILKRKLQRDGFFKIIKLKNTYEKPSEKKKRILQENIKRVKKLNKLKNRTNNKTSKYYRYLNEVPTVLLILIVFVVIIKPL